MKNFARVTGWILMVVGVLTVLGSLVTGMAGLIYRLAAGNITGIRLIRIAIPWNGIVFGCILFMGLHLLGLGQVIILLSEKSDKKEGLHSLTRPLQVEPTNGNPMISPPASPKPARSRKIAGK